jgi:dTDP-4-dehydrorhamnose 3,5-epimerase
VQDNHSRSRRGVLRGLHYQLPPHAQGKLVRCPVGEVWDVAVDLRRHSPSFGHWWGTVLSAANHAQLWIPPGFAHGFVTLSEEAEVQYKVTARYAPDHERCIVWDDPTLQVEWPLAGQPLVSEKDAAAPRFADAEVFDDDVPEGSTTRPVGLAARR